MTTTHAPETELFDQGLDNPPLVAGTPEHKTSWRVKASRSVIALLLAGGAGGGFLAKHIIDQKNSELATLTVENNDNSRTTKVSKWLMRNHITTASDIETNSGSTIVMLKEGTCEIAVIAKDNTAYKGPEDPRFAYMLSLQSADMKGHVYRTDNMQTPAEVASVMAENCPPMK